VPRGRGFVQEGYTTYGGDLVAALCSAGWPPMLLYIALSRPIQASLATGAVKI
jgi:hypothetical protein